MYALFLTLPGVLGDVRKTSSRILHSYPEIPFLGWKDRFRESNFIFLTWMSLLREGGEYEFERVVKWWVEFKFKLGVWTEFEPIPVGNSCSYYPHVSPMTTFCFSWKKSRITLTGVLPFYWFVSARQVSCTRTQPKSRTLHSWQETVSSFFSCTSWSFLSNELYSSIWTRVPPVSVWHPVNDVRFSFSITDLESTISGY